MDLIHHPNENVRKFIIIFLNSLASESAGRKSELLKYDSRNPGNKPELIETLVGLIQKETSDSVMRQNILGILQKLSLRVVVQTRMIELGMIKWIVNVVRNEVGTLSEYSLEYATALLMNLTLRTVGKNACEEPGLGVLSLLNDLLEHENFQIRTYVNGTLYSLFSRSTLKEQAHSLGMLAYLEELMKSEDQQQNR